LLFEGNLRAFSKKEEEGTWAFLALKKGSIAGKKKTVVKWPEDAAVKKKTLSKRKSIEVPYSGLPLV